MNIEKIKERVVLIKGAAIRPLLLIGIKRQLGILRKDKKNKIAVLVGTPLHKNIGDQAIAMAEELFLIGQGFSVVQVPTELALSIDKWASLIHEDDYIFGHGGGNMGDLYPLEEEYRRRMIAAFPGQKITIFPQTICFTDTEFGQEELSKSILTYSNHRDLTILVRESGSLKQAREYFPENNIILTPDIVLSMEGRAGRGHQSSKLLLCFRGDKEKRLNSNHQIALREIISNKIGAGYDYTDMVSGRLFTFSRSRHGVVNAKLEQFSNYQVVFTDRLHGMIFAVLAGVPCVAFDNSEGKVGRVYRDWLKDMPHIVFCDSIDDVNNVDFAKLTSSASRYSPAVFKEYWHEIASSINRK